MSCFSKKQNNLKQEKFITIWESWGWGCGGGNMYIHAFSCVLNLLSQQKRRNSIQKKERGNCRQCLGTAVEDKWAKSQELSGGTGVLANSGLTCGDKDPGRDWSPDLKDGEVGYSISCDERVIREKTPHASTKENVVHFIVVLWFCHLTTKTKHRVRARNCARPTGSDTDGPAFMECTAHQGSRTRKTRGGAARRPRRRARSIRQWICSATKADSCVLWHQLRS